MSYYQCIYYYSYTTNPKGDDDNFKKYRKKSLVERCTPLVNSRNFKRVGNTLKGNVDQDNIFYNSKCSKVI